MRRNSGIIAALAPAGMGHVTASLRRLNNAFSGRVQNDGAVLVSHALGIAAYHGF